MATKQFPFGAKATNTPAVVTKDTHMIDADGGDILNISMSDFVEQTKDESFAHPQCVEDKENCAGSQVWASSSKVFGASTIKTQISALTSRVFPSSKKNEYSRLVDNSEEKGTDDMSVPGALSADYDLAASKLVDPAVPETAPAGNKTRSSLLEKPLWEPKHGAPTARGGLFSPKTAYTPMGTGRRSRIHSTGGAAPRAEAIRGTGVQPRQLGVKPAEGLSKSTVHSKRSGSGAEVVHADLSRTCVFEHLVADKPEHEEKEEGAAEGRLFALTASARARVKAGPPQAPPAVSSNKPRFKTVVRPGGQGIFSPTAPLYSTTPALEASDPTSTTAEKSILSASALTPKARLLAPTASSAAKAVRKPTACPGTGTGTGTGTREMSDGDADVAYAVLGSLPCLPPSTEKPILSGVVVEEEDGSWDFAYPTGSSPSPPPGHTRLLSPTQQLPPMLEPQVQCTDNAGEQGCEGYVEVLEVTDEGISCAKQLACLPASPTTTSKDQPANILEDCAQHPLCHAPAMQGPSLSSPIQPLAPAPLLASPVSTLSSASASSPVGSKQHEQTVTGTVPALHTASTPAAPVTEEVIGSTEEMGQAAESTSPSCGAVPMQEVHSPALDASEHDLQLLMARLSALGVHTSGGSQASHATHGSMGTRYSGKSWGATATQHCLGTASAVLAALQSAHGGSTGGTFSLPQWAVDGDAGMGAQQHAEDVVMAGEGKGAPAFQSPGAATVASAGIASLARSRSKVSLLGTSQHHSGAVGGTAAGWSMRSPPPVHGAASSASGSAARSALPLPDLSPDASHAEGQDRRGSDALTVLESYCSTPMGTVMGSTGLTQRTRPDSAPPGESEDAEGGGGCTPITMAHSTGALGALACQDGTPGGEEVDLSALLARLQALGVHVSGQSHATHGSVVSRVSGKSWGATATAQCLTTAASVLAALHTDSSEAGVAQSMQADSTGSGKAHEKAAIFAVPAWVTTSSVPGDVHPEVVGEQAEEQERQEPATESPRRHTDAAVNDPADESTSSVSSPSVTPQRRPGLWVKTTTPSTGARMSGTCNKGKASPPSAQGMHGLSTSAFTSPVPCRALTLPSPPPAAPAAVLLASSSFPAHFLQAQEQAQEGHHNNPKRTSSDDLGTQMVSEIVAGLVHTVLDRCGEGGAPDTPQPVDGTDQEGRGELVGEGGGEEEAPGALMSPLPARAAAQGLLSPVPAVPSSQLKRTPSLFMSPRRVARQQARAAVEGGPSVTVEAVAVQGYRVVKEKAGGGLAGLLTTMSSGHAVYILRYMVRRTEGHADARPQAQLAAAKAGLQRTLSRKGSRAFMAVRSPVRGAGSSGAVTGQRVEGLASPRAASTTLLSPQRRLARPASVVRLLSPRETLASPDRSRRSVVTVSKRYSDFHRLWVTLTLHLQAALSAQQRGKLTALHRYGLPTTLLGGGMLQAACACVESFPFPAKARLGGSSTEVAVMLARQKAFDSMLALLLQYQLTQLKLVKQFLEL